jgi:hypothetical protein
VKCGSSTHATMCLAVRPRWQSIARRVCVAMQRTALRHMLQHSAAICCTALQRALRCNRRQCGPSWAKAWPRTSCKGACTHTHAHTQARARTHRLTYTRARTHARAHNHKDTHVRRWSHSVLAYGHAGAGNPCSLCGCVDACVCARACACTCVRTGGPFAANRRIRRMARVYN